MTEAPCTGRVAHTGPVRPTAERLAAPARVGEQVAPAGAAREMPSLPAPA